MNSDFNKKVLEKELMDLFADDTILNPEMVNGQLACVVNTQKLAEILNNKLIETRKEVIKEIESLKVSSYQEPNSEYGPNTHNGMIDYILQTIKE